MKIDSNDHQREVDAEKLNQYTIAYVIRFKLNVSKESDKYTFTDFMAFVFLSQKKDIKWLLFKERVLRKPLITDFLVSELQKRSDKVW